MGEMMSCAKTRPRVIKQMRNAFVVSYRIHQFGQKQVGVRAGKGLRVIALQFGGNLRHRFHVFSSECSSSSVLALRPRGSSCGKLNISPVVQDVHASILRRPPLMNWIRLSFIECLSE